MSKVESVNALREAIRVTDEYITRNPLIKLAPEKAKQKKNPPKKIDGQQKILDAANAVASIAGPYGAILKLFTGASVEQDWKAFVGEYLPRLNESTEKDEFDLAVAKFTSLRSALMAKGYNLPFVTIPIWKTDNKTYLAYAGLALLIAGTGVFLFLRR